MYLVAGKEQEISAEDIEGFRGRLSLTCCSAAQTEKMAQRAVCWERVFGRASEVAVNLCVASMGILTNVPIGSNPLRQSFYPHEPQTAQDIYG